MLRKYCTTKLLTKEKPLLKQKTEYKLERKLLLSPNSERKGEGGLRTKGLFKKSYENKPLISIVTVVYNGEKYLEQTIKSVLDQGYDNVEYIIIDGGSIDSTLDIIKKYEAQIDYWVSEPDIGIYNAMNKGTSLCSGDYVAFLNADDWYNKDTVEIVVNRLARKQKVDYLFGNVAMYENGTISWVFKENLKKHKSNMPLGHPSLYLKRSVLLTKKFDENYKIVADYDLVLRLVNENYSYAYIDQTLANYRIGGISSTGDLAAEHFTLWHNHFGLIQAIDSYMLRHTNKTISQRYEKTKYLIKKFLDKHKLIT